MHPWPGERRRVEAVARAAAWRPIASISRHAGSATAAAAPRWELSPPNRQRVRRRRGRLRNRRRGDPASGGRAAGQLGVLPSAALRAGPLRTAPAAAHGSVKSSPSRATWWRSPSRDSRRMAAAKCRDRGPDMRRHGRRIASAVRPSAWQPARRAATPILLGPFLLNPYRCCFDLDWMSSFVKLREIVKSLRENGVGEPASAHKVVRVMAPTTTSVRNPFPARS